MPLLRDALKRSLDSVRSIPGLLSLRPYTVSVLVRTWSGSRPGMGSKTDVLTPIKVGRNQDPNVRKLSSRDVIASGGLYQDMDLEVTFTPEFFLDGYGGVAIETFDPPAEGKEIFFIVSGPGLPQATFKKVGQTVLEPLTHKIILRKTAQVTL